MENHQQAQAGLSGSEQQPSAFSELLADWFSIYAANFGREPEESAAVAYRIGLSDLRKLELLHRAFTHCLRECRFWPTVAEIRAAYSVEVEAAASEERKKRPRLPAAPEEEMTIEEGKAFAEEIRKTIANLPTPEWAKDRPRHPEKLGPSLVRTAADDARIAAQLEQLKAKYPEDFTPEKIEAARKIAETGIVGKVTPDEKG